MQQLAVHNTKAAVLKSMVRAPLLDYFCLPAVTETEKNIALNMLNIFQNLFDWNDGINNVASTQSYRLCFSCSFICHGC